MKIKNDQDEEIEVYTAEEKQADIAAAVAIKEAEFGKTKTEIEAERDEARKALGERTGEIKQFRKLNDEVVAKLSVAERTIYENQLHQKEQDDKRVADEKKAYDAKVDTVIRTKANGDEKLFGKLKDMYQLINIEVHTDDDITKRVSAALGALGQTEPDLIATVFGAGNGSFEPPKKVDEGEKSFADTEAGRKGAAALGLMMEPPKKDK